MHISTYLNTETGMSATALVLSEAPKNVGDSLARTVGLVDLRDSHGSRLASVDMALDTLPERLAQRELVLDRSTLMVSEISSRLVATNAMSPLSPQVIQVFGLTKSGAEEWHAVAGKGLSQWTTGVVATAGRA